MKMSIHGKQLVVTDAIKKYAETKLGRVEKYHDSIIELDVSLSAVRTKTGSSHTAEVLAYLSGSTLKASCTDTDLYAAIDQVSDIIEAQLKKHKEKRAINYGQVPGVKKIKYDPETNTVEKEAVQESKDMSMYYNIFIGLIVLLLSSFMIKKISKKK